MTQTPSGIPQAAGKLPAVLLLYDDECALCHGFVRFILARDRRDVFHFAPLQGKVAAELLAWQGPAAEAIDTVVLVLHAGTMQEHRLVRAAAVTETLRLLGGPWLVLAQLSGILPGEVRDRAYRWLARHRCRLFGKANVAKGEKATGEEANFCPVPDAADRSRFL